MRILFLRLLICSLSSYSLSPGGQAANASENPFSEAAKIRVLIFARTDCPITNRYAPEIDRIANEFAGQSVRFWIVYPDASETPAKIAAHMSEYHLPGHGISDPKLELRKRAEARISPQAAVFSGAKLVYSGRIDDRYVAFGKSRAEPEVHDLENAIKAALRGQAIAQPRTKAIGCYLDDLQ
jgi:hypothetical protein